jgi:hypothetical protein
MFVIVWLQRDGFPTKVSGFFDSVEEARSNLTTKGYKIEVDNRVGHGAPDEGLCYRKKGFYSEVAYIRTMQLSKT